jgi:hypothetical protein
MSSWTKVRFLEHFRSVQITTTLLTYSSNVDLNVSGPLSKTGFFNLQILEKLSWKNVLQTFDKRRLQHELDTHRLVLLTEHYARRSEGAPHSCEQITCMYIYFLQGDVASSECFINVRFHCACRDEDGRGPTCQHWRGDAGDGF